MHPVVFDLERGDAGARPLADFQFGEECSAVVLDAAQFIKIGIVTVGDHAAFADDGGRLGFDGLGQQFGQRVLWCKINGERTQLAVGCTTQRGNQCRQLVQ